MFKDRQHRRCDKWQAAFTTEAAIVLDPARMNAHLAWAWMTTAASTLCSGGAFVLNGSVVTIMTANRV